MEALKTVPAAEAAPNEPFNFSSVETAVIEKVRAAVKIAVVKGDFEIPPLPHITMEVLKLVNQPNINLSTLETLVKQDQSMTVRIIKTANSPIFRGVQEITTLQQAMARIGLKNVKDVVVSLSFQSKALDGTKYQQILKMMWEYSIGTALISQELADRLTLNGDMAFMSGLLASIGNTVLLQVIAKIEKQEMILARQAAYNVKKAFDEKKYSLPGLKEIILPHVCEEFGSTVGTAVAAKWALPEASIATIKHQVAPGGATETYRKLVWTINLAQLLCKNFGFGVTRRPVDFENAPSIKELAIEKSAFDVLLHTCQEKVSTKLAAFVN